MLVFHPAGEAHAQAHESGVSSLNVEVGPGWLSRIQDLAGVLDQPVEFRSGTRVADAGFRLLRELLDGDGDGDAALSIESLALEILAASARKGCGEGTARPRWLRDARDLLGGRFREPLALRSVAKEAGVHPVHFASAFRRFYGCSVGEYLRRLRVEFAQRQLASPELSLAEVALAAGFADQSHLTRTFKRLTGLTPGQYRTFLTFKTRGSPRSTLAR